MTTKNLEHYIANPSDVDGLSEEEQQKLLAELTALDGAPPKEAPAKEAPAEPAKVAPAEGDDAKEPAKEPAKADGEVVLAPDGKSTIPYAVLQGERQARAAAEKALAEVTETMTSLTERIKALEAGDPDPGKGGASADEIEQAIAKLEDEAPAVGESMREITSALLKTLREQEERLKALTETQEKTDEEIQNEVNEAVQRAIDAQPALVEWRANNPQLWAQAGKIDDALKLDPEWHDKPFEDRFAKVVEAMVAIHGDSIMPAGAKAPEAKPTPKPSAEEIKKAAEAALDKSKPKPVTLTDLPGGAPTEQSEEERVESMSPTQLLAKFQTMTAEQQQAYLRGFST